MILPVKAPLTLLTASYEILLREATPLPLLRTLNEIFGFAYGAKLEGFLIPEIVIVLELEPAIAEVKVKVIVLVL